MDIDEYKTFLTDNKHRINLHQLLHEETEKVYGLIEGYQTRASEPIEAAKEWFRKVETAEKDLCQMLFYGCYFGSTAQSGLWEKTLDRLATVPHVDGIGLLVEAQLYPALLAFYSAGIASLEANNTQALRALFSANTSKPHNKPKPLSTEVHCWIIGTDEANIILDTQNKKTPLSDHLAALLAEDFPKSLIGKYGFDMAFDRWETLVSMFVAHTLKDRQSGAWAPIGRFSWRAEAYGQNGLGVLESEIEKFKNKWPPIIAGLFPNHEVAKEALDFVKQLASRFNF
jgi:hypothetical protein